MNLRHVAIREKPPAERNSGVSGLAADLQFSGRGQITSCHDEDSSVRDPTTRSPIERALVGRASAV
jgi:hypothetical protein